MCCVQPEDGHYQSPKHVVVPYVENTLYSTNKYSCVRPVHTLYIMSDQYTHCALCQTSTHTVHYVRPVHTLCISYFIEHIGDDEPYDRMLIYRFQLAYDHGPSLREGKAVGA